METVSVSNLKSNPAEALCKTRKGPVVVMNRNRPDALMVSLDSSNLLDMAGAREALATALFRDGHLSLARSARVARMPLPAFIAHLSRLGIAVVRLSAEETARDLDTLDQWLALS